MRKKRNARNEKHRYQPLQRHVTGKIGQDLQIPLKLPFQVKLNSGRKEEDIQIANKNDWGDIERGK